MTSRKLLCKRRPGTVLQLCIEHCFLDTLCVDTTLTLRDRPSNAADQATDKAYVKPRTMAAAGGAAAPISLKARQKVGGSADFACA